MLLVHLTPSVSVRCLYVFNSYCVLAVIVLGRAFFDSVVANDNGDNILWREEPLTYLAALWNVLIVLFLVIEILQINEIVEQRAINSPKFNLG